MEWNRPLYLRVVELAPKAALHDPRFSPVDKDELPATRLEISVLAAPRPLVDARDLVLGRDGVELKKGSAHAVFLPQVAPEHGWDRNKLLQQLALKAGLPEDGWRDAELSVFRGEVFGEPRKTAG
jgi:AmmeMemoRadiSam system protein A